jgi:hypothetical protein
MSRVSYRGTKDLVDDGGYFFFVFHFSMTMVILAVKKKNQFSFKTMLVVDFFIDSYRLSCRKPVGYRFSC